MNQIRIGDHVVEVGGSRVGMVLSYAGGGAYRVKWEDDTVETVGAAKLRLERELGIADEIEALEEAGEIETGPARRTMLEIDDLKWQWRRDPCWDIEDTEGFEAHYDELKAWRDEYEAINCVRFEPLPVATCDESYEVDEDLAALKAVNREMELKLIHCVMALEETARLLPDGSEAKAAAERVIEDIHDYTGRGVTYTLPGLAPLVERWVVVRLVHELRGAEYDSNENNELAEYLNEGWEVMDISTNTVGTDMITGNWCAYHYQVVTLRRLVAVDNLPARESDEADAPRSLGDALRDASAALRMPDPPVHEQDTQPVDVTAFLTAPDSWLGECREAAAELKRRAEARGIGGSDLRDLLA